MKICTLKKIVIVIIKFLVYKILIVVNYYSVVTMFHFPTYKWKFFYKQKMVKIVGNLTIEIF